MADKKSLMAQLQTGLRTAVNEIADVAKEGVQAVKEDVEAIRGSTFAKGVDKVIEATDQFLGPSGKAWMANGLDELRQAIAPGTEEVQAGNNPGLWGTITTGEATIDRTGKLSLDELRGYAEDRAKEAEQSMERTQERDGRE